MMGIYVAVDLLRQLGIGGIDPKGRKRIVLAVDFPEHGGARIRDLADLTGDELWEFRCEIRRLLAADLRRQGYTWGGRKGSTRRKVAVAA